MDNLRKSIDLLANVAIIVVAVLLSIVLVKNYLFRRPASRDERKVPAFVAEPRRGEKINLTDVDWQGNGRTLLLALSTTCHFCSESAPFYQQLVQAKSDTRLIAVLPQATEEGRQYLRRLGVTIDEVKQAPFGSLNVRGTPTLILVDRDGVIINTWVGRLATEQEAEVLNTVQGKRMGD